MAHLRYLADPHPYFADFPRSLPPGTEVTWMSRDRLPISPDPGLEIDEFGVAARGGYEICVRRYRSTRKADKELAVLVYMHGGGWVTGSLETDDPLCRCLAVELPLVVLNVEYRLAPEHKFPVGIEDCYDVVKWVASSEGQQRLNADLSKGFLVGGTSAGAQFTASIAPLYRDAGFSPPITGIVFLAGNLVDTRATPAQYRDSILSVDEITSAPGLTKEAVDYFAQVYDADPFDVRRSPLLFQSWKDVAKKAVISVCGWDPRRDEGILFETLLKEAGMQVRMDVHKGLPHGFWTVCRSLDVSKEWETKVVRDIGWLLQGDAA